MKIGVTLRNMGIQSTPEMMKSCAECAEQLGFESIWITDHIAIPPDDSEGSGGRYTDPLTTLAWIAGFTTTLNLGVGVLILPYRPALPTAKQIATIQELSNDRLLLGAGVGWMEPEFRALGIDRRQRGKITDNTLAFFKDYFDNEVVTERGQPLIVNPRPPIPETYIGGSAPHALQRALKFGHGWMPMARNVDKLAEGIKQFSQMAEAAGTLRGPVTVMTGLPLDESGKAREMITAFSALEIERLVCSIQYNTEDDYRQALTKLASIVSRDQGVI